MAARAGVWLIWFAVMVTVIVMTIVVAFVLANLPQEMIGLAVVAFVGVILVEQLAARRA